MLNLTDLPNKLVREHVNELAQLLSNAQKHIPDVILPVRNRVSHATILLYNLLCHALDLIKLLESALVALVNEMNLSVVDETFDTSVSLLLFLPKVERHTVLRTNLNRFAS